jgi:hypothetical protein
LIKQGLQKGMAVDGVSREPFSESHSLLIGKNTGKTAIFA